MFGKKNAFAEGKFNIPQIEPLSMMKTATNCAYGLAKGISLDDVNNVVATISAQSVAKSQKDMEIAMLKAQEEERRKALEAQNNEEWIWIEGYKGTDKDMKCRDYQYELNKQHDMPEDAIIMDCSCGFHLCANLKDVFGYYELGGGNKFFKVSALVRKKDYEEYLGYGIDGHSPSQFFYNMWNRRNKFAAKSIIFLSECSPNEIFNAYAENNSYNKDILDWSEEDKKEAIATSITDVRNKVRVKKLVELGYSEPMSKLLIDRCHYDEAVAAASQTDLSMDMRIAYIIMND